VIDPVLKLAGHQSATVRVSIDVSKMNGQNIHVGMKALEELRAAKVPVHGYLWPMGVTEGELVSRYDPMFGELTFEWRP
jgi:hypothetical protein